MCQRIAGRTLQIPLSNQYDTWTPPELDSGWKLNGSSASELASRSRVVIVGSERMVKGEGPRRGFLCRNYEGLSLHLFSPGSACGSQLAYIEPRDFSGMGVFAFCRLIHGQGAKQLAAS